AIEELLARIRANIRKKTHVYEIGKLRIDTSSHIATYDGEMLVLTKKEFDLLVYLIENRNKVISREQALVTVWGYDFVGSTNVVDVYIRYLRAKIDDKYGINLIETVRGFGYVIR
ncbi:MAG: response regulator transcription factor, partial [Clostridia bacterium]|nr:response regulator transcription factor [Clostridia bacterium]